MQAKKRTNRDRVWFVTGAANGFGHAVASAALARGERVVAVDIEAQPIDELARAHENRALPLTCDVTDAAAVRTAAQQSAARFGRIDVVFNNAGYGHVGAAEELSDAELRRQIDVNLFGNINVARVTLPYLRRQRSGHLLAMSSLNGVEGLVGGSYYAASKFAIEGSRSLSRTRSRRSASRSRSSSLARFARGSSATNRRGGQRRCRNTRKPWARHERCCAG